MKKIFVSHASKDEPLVKSLIDDILIGALSVRVSEIFCTTTDGTKIESGEDWRNSIQDALRNSLVTLLIITPNYKEREVCICEMGAAWVTSAKVIPLIVEPITYSTVGIVQKPKQVEKLLDDRSLDRLRDVVQERLIIDPKEIRSDRWSTKKIEFLTKAKQHLVANPFSPPLSRDEFDQIINERADLEKAVESLVSEKSDLESLVAELKQAKDAQEIKQIERRHRKIDPIDEFFGLCKVVTEKLSKFPSIVRGMIFIDISGKDIHIGYEGCQEQIDDAISRDYINEDLTPDWDTTKLMRELSQALGELNAFVFEKEQEQEFVEAYEEQFEAPLSMANKDFWEDAFSVGISIS